MKHFTQPKLSSKFDLSNSIEDEGFTSQDGAQPQSGSVMVHQKCYDGPYCSATTTLHLSAVFSATIEPLPYPVSVLSALVSD